jgi:hypothetical protein
MSDTRELDAEIRLAIYRLFVEAGHAPVPATIASSINATSAEVEAGLQRLHDDHMIVLAPGTPYIWMANPFSALPTPYTVSVGDKTFWGNCIWDSLGIVAILGSDGTVTAPCPDCSEELRVEIRSGTLVPAEHIVHFTVPARHWWDDIGFN